MNYWNKNITASVQYADTECDEGITLTEQLGQAPKPLRLKCQTPVGKVLIEDLPPTSGSLTRGWHSRLPDILPAGLRLSSCHPGTVSF